MKRNDSRKANGTTEEEPFFSIVTVCLNAADTIGGTIRSVLMQTDPDYEYILVDGGSTDGTTDEIRKMMGEGHRADPPGHGYRLISGPDQGVYDAMNKAVRKASGKYIYFLNAGDHFHDATVLRVIHEELSLNNPRTDLLYGEVCFSYRDRTQISRYTKVHALDFRKIAREHYICHQAVFARKELCLQHPFDLTFRLMADNEWMAYWSKRASSKETDPQKEIRIRAVSVVICDFDMYGSSQIHAGSSQGLWEADEIARRYDKPVYILTSPLKTIARKLRGSSGPKAPAEKGSRLKKEDTS